MSRPRVSIRERKARAVEAAAEAHSAPAQPVAEESRPAARVEETSTEERQESEPRRVRSAPTSTSSSMTATSRIGIYFHPDEFDRAKSAYLADWTNGGQADTFAKWIAAALDAHAAAGPAARAASTRTRPEGQGSGWSRSFTLPTDTVERMRAAIVDDQRANRWLSESAWAGEAVATAADKAEEKAGEALPPAPARLPNRLRR